MGLQAAVQSNTDNIACLLSLKVTLVAQAAVSSGQLVLLVIAALNRPLAPLVNASHFLGSAAFRGSRGAASWSIPAHARPPLSSSSPTQDCFTLLQEKPSAAMYGPLELSIFLHLLPSWHSLPSVAHSAMAASFASAALASSSAFFCSSTDNLFDFSAAASAAFAAAFLRPASAACFLYFLSASASLPAFTLRSAERRAFSTLAWASFTLASFALALASAFLAAAAFFAIFFISALAAALLAAASALSSLSFCLFASLLCF